VRHRRRIETSSLYTSALHNVSPYHPQGTVAAAQNRTTVRRKCHCLHILKGLGTPQHHGGATPIPASVGQAPSLSRSQPTASSTAAILPQRHARQSNEQARHDCTADRRATCAGPRAAHSGPRLAHHGADGWARSRSSSLPSDASHRRSTIGGT
jgi:hypothetical protein